VFWLGVAATTRSSFSTLHDHVGDGCRAHGNYGTKRIRKCTNYTEERDRGCRGRSEGIWEASSRPPYWLGHRNFLQPLYRHQIHALKQHNPSLIHVIRPLFPNFPHSPRSTVLANPWISCAACSMLGFILQCSMNPVPVIEAVHIDTNYSINPVSMLSALV
jgi:hypothetical protein